MNTVLDRSARHPTPVFQWSIIDGDTVCSTDLPDNIRIVTVFHGTAADGTQLFNTLVYVEDTYDVVLTSFSCREAWTNHAEIVASTGTRIRVA